MNELKIFDNKEFGQIRTIEIDGEPWFVGKDIAEALGYGNPRQAISTNVDEEDKGVHSMDTPSGKQNMTVINESGLYSLILGSKLPNAKKFKHWVTKEVLPSIRKTGGYHLPQTYSEALRELADKEEENERLKQEMLLLDEKVSEMKPKVDYVDAILENPNTMLVTQIAQDYGMSAIKFNQILKEHRVQHKVGEQWILYSDYQGMGYVQSHTHTFDKQDGTKGLKPNTEWTQKGRFFLYNFLKSKGIIPLIEREAS